MDAAKGWQGCRARGKCDAEERVAASIEVRCVRSFTFSIDLWRILLDSARFWCGSVVESLNLPRVFIGNECPNKDSNSSNESEGGRSYRSPTPACEPVMLR